MDKLFINYSGNIESFKRLGLEETYKKCIVFIEKGGAIYTHNTYYAGPDIIKSIQEALSELQEEVKEGDYVASIRQVDGKIETTMGSFEGRDSKILEDSKSYTNELKRDVTTAIATEYIRATGVEKSLSERIDSHLDITERELSEKADKYSVYDKDQIDQKLTGVYKIKGSCTFENLPETNTVGDVYNITNSFTLDEKEYTSGTNVVYTENGWDVLAGIFDTSELELEIQRVSNLLAQEVVRAIKAENDLEDKINEEVARAQEKELELDKKFDDYLPLSGGTVRGAVIIDHRLTANYRTTLANNAALAFIGSDNTERLLMPHSSNNYELSFNNGQNTSWYKIYHQGNDGKDSGLDADMLDGLHASSFARAFNNASLEANDASTFPFSYGGRLAGAKNVPFESGAFLHIGTTHYNMQLNSQDQTLKFRTSDSPDYKNGWKTIAFTDSNITGNAATATDADKLDGKHARDFYDLKGGTLIPNDSDLNDYLTPGTYKVQQNSDATTIINTPIQSAFVLKVSYPTGTIAYVKQEITCWDTFETKTRLFVVSTSNWTSWVTMSTNLETYNAPTATKLATPVKIWGNNFDGSKDISINSPATMPFVYFTNIDGSKGGYIGRARSNNNDIIINGLNAGIDLITGDVSRVFVNNNGNVGIGTTDPKYKLYVDGTIKSTGKILINDDEVITEAPSDTTMYARSNKSWVPISGYEDLVSYGVKWEKNATSPICTRIGNPLLHKELPIQSQFRGCIYDYKTGVFKYWLNPNDWSLKEDGTASVLDGTDGDVCVHTPKFYGKSGEDNGYYWVRISLTKIDDSWIEIPEMYIGAYRSTVDRTNSLARSIVNTSAQYRGGINSADYDQYLETDPFRTLLGKPATNISRANMRTYCRNNNSEMLSYEQYKWIFYWAYIIEYANFNAQAGYNEELTTEGYRQGGLGNGMTTWSDSNWNQYNNYNPITPCGYGNNIGNFTGIKIVTVPAYTERDGTTSVTEKSYQMPRWRGFDNPFGDIWTNLDGVIIQGYVDLDGNPSYKEVYTTTDPTKYGDTLENMLDMNIAGIEIYKARYTLEFDLRETAEIIPSAVGASATTGKCDYHYVQDSSTNYTNLRTLLVGGRANYGGAAGPGCFTSAHGVGLAWHTFGFRMVKEIKD